METNKTYHLWTNEFSIETQKTILKIKKLIVSEIYKSFFFKETNHHLLLLNDMDEYYQSAPNNNIGSDRVFVTPHIDGFLGWIPFMKTWRCIYGLNGPHQTTTKIPFLTDENIVISNNSFYCFDFNRDLHWVYQNNNTISTNSRKILKLHFFDYPRWLSFLSDYYAYLNIEYNKFARNQFLFSQDPYNNPATFIVSILINGITLIGGSIENYFGFVNLFVIFLIIKNNTLKNKIYYLKNAAYFVFICCNLNETTKPQLFRDTYAYLLSIIPVLTYIKYKTNTINMYIPTYSVEFPRIIFLIVYFSGIFYTIEPFITKKEYYTDLYLFQEYHKNKYNQIVHLVTTSYGVLGILKFINKYLNMSYINLLCFLFLYTRYLIPDPDVENISVLLFSFYILILKKYPNKFKNPIKIILVSVLFQEASHYIFNEPTYMGTYLSQKNQNELFLKHIIWLIPFEIRTLIN